MSDSYCPSCKRETGHKRKIGIGTLILVIVTCGWWLLAILFYSKRCAVCGCQEEELIDRITRNYREATGAPPKKTFWEAFKEGYNSKN